MRALRGSETSCDEDHPSAEEMTERKVRRSSSEFEYGLHDPDITVAVFSPIAAIATTGVQRITVVVISWLVLIGGIFWVL